MASFVTLARCRLCPVPLCAFVLGVLGLACATPARADEAEAPTRLSLSDAIAVALRTHPRLQSAEAQLAVDRAYTGRALAGFLPSLTFGGSGYYTYSNFVPTVGNAANATTSYNFASQEQFLLQLTLNQTVYDSGRTSGQYRSAQETARSAEADRDATRAQVEGDVVDAYFGVLEANALAAISDEAIKLSEAHLAHAKSLVRAGLKPELDQLAADTQLSQAKLDQVHAANAALVALARLRTTLGLGEGDIVLADEAIAPFTEESTAPDQVVASALAQRPELRSADHHIASARAQVTAARGDYFPLIQLQGIGEAIGTFPRPDPNQPALLYSIQGILTLTQPIFSGLATYRSVQVARGQVAMAEAAREQQRRDLSLQVMTARLAVDEARAALAAATAVALQADKQLTSANNRYQGGLSTAVDVREAQNGAIRARAQAVDARYRLEVGRARLVLALGRSLLTGAR